MDFNLTDEQRKLVAIAREVSQPFAARSLGYDHDAAFPKKNFQELKDAGLVKMTVPKQFGGHGLWQDKNYLAYYLVLAEIARQCSSTAQLLQVHSHGVGIVARAANEQQMKRYMPAVSEGGALFASAGSEASVRKGGAEGFDAILKRKGKDYSLTGFKGFASLASDADFYVIWSLLEGTQKMEDGMMFAVVPKGREGVRLENNWDTFGMRPTVSWNIHLQDVPVAEDEVVGGPGDWVQRDPRTFTLGFASNHIGSAWGVFDFVKDYFSKREDLRAQPTAQVDLGNAEVQIQAAEALLYRAACMWEAGDYEAAELMSMRTLHLAKQAGLGIATKAFDLCGARSTFNDQRLGMFYRDMRTFTLHFREDRLLQMLSTALTGGEFHSKQRYGRKLPMKQAASSAA
jgi:alkylation response protein AidB-like acyl-CoA dehydrogenase